MRAQSRPRGQRRGLGRRAGEGRAPRGPEARQSLRARSSRFRGGCVWFSAKGLRGPVGGTHRSLGPEPPEPHGAQVSLAAQVGRPGGPGSPCAQPRAPPPPCGRPPSPGCGDAGGGRAGQWAVSWRRCDPAARPRPAREVGRALRASRRDPAAGGLRFAPARPGPGTRSSGLCPTINSLFVAVGKVEPTSQRRKRRSRTFAAGEHRVSIKVSFLPVPFSPQK